MQGVTTNILSTDSYGKNVYYLSDLISEITLEKNQLYSYDDISYNLVVNDTLTLDLKETEPLYVKNLKLEENDSTKVIYSVETYKNIVKQANAPNLASPKTGMGGALLNNRAIIAGGYNGTNANLSVVESYTNTLTKTALTAITNTVNGCSGNYSNNYALIVGGTNGTVSVNTVNVYNTSFVKSTAAALSETKSRAAVARNLITDIMFFAGGNVADSATCRNTVDIYSTTLVKTTSTLKTARRTNGVSVDRYVLFVGGYDGTTSTDAVDCYDENNVKVTIANLSNARNAQSNQMESYKSFEDYAVIAGGGRSLITYDKNLVCNIVPLEVTINNNSAAPTLCNNKMLIASRNTENVFIIDKNFNSYVLDSTTTPKGLSAARYGGSSMRCLDDYVLFFGGYLVSGGACANTVEVWKVPEDTSTKFTVQRLVFIA